MSDSAQKADDNKSSGHVTEERWVQQWEVGNTKWHRDKVNQHLEKHYNLLAAGRSELKVFIPLCGKSADLKWLYDKGHTVVGVELADKAIEDFYKENYLKYNVTDLPQIKGKLYKSEDGRLRLYCCNILLFTKDLEGDCNAVIDRGSFEAMNIVDRESYMEMIRSVITEDCQYFLSNAKYHLSELPSGPPHMLSMDVIKKLLGDDSVIDELDTIDNIASGFGAPRPNMTKFDEILYHIRKRRE